MESLGTAKQADLIVKLAAKLGKLQSSDHAELWRREALQAPQARVRSIIADLNAELGFSGLSKATDKQRIYICDMEKKIFGQYKTKPTELLTYAEADDRIKRLRQDIAASKGEQPTSSIPETNTGGAVIDIITRFAV